MNRVPPTYTSLSYVGMIRKQTKSGHTPRCYRLPDPPHMRDLTEKSKSGSDLIHQDWASLWETKKLSRYWAQSMDESLTALTFSVFLRLWNHPSHLFLIISGLCIFYLLICVRPEDYKRRDIGKVIDAAGMKRALLFIS
jgi:hypothetical protein